MTNADKYAQLETLIKDRYKAFIDEHFKGQNQPAVVYEAVSYKTIEEWKVRYLSCHQKAYPYLYNPKKVTNKDLSALQDYYNTMNLSVQDILIFVERERSSRAFKLVDVTGERIAYTKEELAPYMARMAELYAPREGHQPCAYCSKQFPQDKKVTRTIHFSAWDQYLGRQVAKSESREFCSSECAAYCQMGSEG
jgi:hypothetical protein